MTKITLPKLGASDNSATVVDIIIPNGSFIERNTIFLEVETSKSLHEIESVSEGYIYHNLEIGQEVHVGNVVAIVSAVEVENPDELFKKSKKPSEKRVTKKAAILLEKYMLDASDFDTDFIREQDVLKKVTSPLKQLSFNEGDTIIIGCGGHASMCLDIAIEMKINVVGFVDDSVRDPFRGIPWIGFIDSIYTLIDRVVKPKLILGIGFLSNLKKRDDVYLKASNHFQFVNLIHPKSVIEKSVTIMDNAGLQIMAGAIIGSEVILGPNSIVNSGAIVSHHSKIGRTCHITPGACLAGNVEVGDRSTVGMNSTIFLGVKILPDTIIPNLTRVDN